MRAVILGMLAAAIGANGAQRPPAAAGPKGVRLESRSWVEAQSLLTADTVVVIPLGAALVQHGPHLKLGTDQALASYFARRVADASAVVVTPPLTYHFYPGFAEYPGSTTLTVDTARDLTIQIVRSLARAGPRRFYVLNTGISSAPALRAAAAALAREGLLLAFTDFSALSQRAAARVRQQEGGDHADELETSLMLHIDPASVDMKSAARDYGAPSTPFRLTRKQGGAGTFSPTGTWGDPTLATAAKGTIVADGVVTGILEDIEKLRTATPPEPEPPVTSPPAPAPVPTGRRQPAPQPERCTPGDERSMRQMGDAFGVHWGNADAVSLALLWSDEGDLVHPDGAVERGRRTIQQNRFEQFMRREYSSSKHFLTVGTIRCLTADVAVVDAKWELRGVYDRTGNLLPRGDGLATLVMKRAAGGWQIEAYRYTVNQQAAVPPTLLKKPGYPDKR